MSEGKVTIGALICFSCWLFIILPMVTNNPSSLICPQRLTSDWAQAYTSAASALATLVAVGVALGVAIFDSLRRFRENERAQAQRVTAWMFEPETKNIDGQHKLQSEVVINNSSDQIVYKVIASVGNAQTGARVGRELNYRRFIGIVPPGMWTYTIDHPGHCMHKSFSIELVFQDAASKLGNAIQGTRGAAVVRGLRPVIEK